MKEKTKRFWLDVLISFGLTVACVILTQLSSLAEISELSLAVLFLTAVGSAVFFAWYSKSIFVFPSTFAITAFIVLAVLTVCAVISANELMSRPMDGTGLDALAAVFGEILSAIFSFIMIIITVVFPPLSFGILLLASFIAQKCLKASAKNEPTVQENFICETEEPQTELQFPEIE